MENSSVGITPNGIEKSKLWKELGFDSPLIDKTGAEYREQSETVQEQSFNSDQAHELAKKSLDFLAAMALPTIWRYFFPDMYQAAWQWLLSYVHKTRDFSQLALGLPRGFAKTTFVKIFLLYVILFTERKFILVCAETHEKAVNIVSDVMAMLDEPNIKKVFGDWRLGKSAEQLGKKVFGFRGREISIVAATVETVRGLNIKNERPDVMVFDDIQSRQAAESMTISSTIETEMIGTAMKAKSPHGCLFIFVGNMYPTKYSILRKLKSNPNWLKFIVGAITQTGESIWEELQPIAQLMKELENDIQAGHPEIFVSEVLNDENAQANNLVDLTALKPWPVSPGDIPGGNCVIIDPSGDKVGSDAVSVGYFEVHNGYLCLMECVEDRLSPLQTIHAALKYCIDHNCNLVAVEGTAYQASLNFWAKWVCEQMSITGIEFVEIYPGSQSKNTRIVNMLKGYGNGEIFVSPETKAAVHLQITSYNPLKRDNIDGLLDLLTYATPVMEVYGAFMAAMNQIQYQEFASTQVPAHNSPF